MALEETNRDESGEKPSVLSRLSCSFQKSA
jgi:hypothetical protein